MQLHEIGSMDHAPTVQGLRCADLVDAMGRLHRHRGEVTPFQANVPVVLEGVVVMPGQYVFADASGAVVIPLGDLDDVLAEARVIEADDARYREDIAREDAPAP